MKYEAQTLIILKLKAKKPLFYNEELFVRYESHNKLIKNGSNEFYTVLDNFKKGDVK